MSIHEIYELFKSQGYDIAQLTCSDVAPYCDSYRRPSWLLAQLCNMAATEANPPKPKRRRTTKRKRPGRPDTGRGGSKRNSASAVFHSQLQAAATLELVERVNGGDTETEIDDNPLRLFNTAPGEQFPRFVVIRPETPTSVLDDLADALPDTGYSQLDNGGLVAGVDY